MKIYWPFLISVIFWSSFNPTSSILAFILNAFFFTCFSPFIIKFFYRCIYRRQGRAIVPFCHSCTPLWWFGIRSCLKNSAESDIGYSFHSETRGHCYMRARGVWFIDLPRRPLIFYHGSLQIRVSTKFLPPPKNTRYTVCQCYSVPLLLLIWYEVTTSINNLGCTSWQTTISLLLEVPK